MSNPNNSSSLPTGQPEGIETIFGRPVIPGHEKEQLEQLSREAWRSLQQFQCEVRSNWFAYFGNSPQNGIETFFGEVVSRKSAL